MAGRIERYRLSVRGSYCRIAFTNVESTSAGAAKGPAGLDRTGDDWQNKNMPYICRAFNWDLQLFDGNRLEAVVLGFPGLRQCQ